MEEEEGREEGRRRWKGEKREGKDTGEDGGRRKKGIRDGGGEAERRAEPRHSHPSSTLVP